MKFMYRIRSTVVTIKATMNIIFNHLLQIQCISQTNGKERDDSNFGNGMWRNYNPSIRKKTLRTCMPSSPAGA